MNAHEPSMDQNPEPGETLECPMCGSTSYDLFDFDGFTGVVAPDGYREPWNGTVLHCKKCGADSEI